VAEWRWELVTDDLLDGLPPAALTAVRWYGPHASWLSGKAAPYLI